MAKISELIYDVREGLREFSDDSEFDDRYIIYLYGLKRAKYLRQLMNNYQKTTDNSVLQTFCIPMIEVNANECSVDVDCDKILRSENKIPKPLDLHTKPAITKIKPTNITSVPFNFVSKDRIPYISDATFKDAMYAFLDPNGYIYVYSTKDTRLMDCLTVTGVFEDPMEMKNYYNCCNCSDTATVCYDEDTTDYPLQAHLIDIIRDEIIREGMRTKSIPEDKINDGTDL